MSAFTLRPQIVLSSVAMVLAGCAHGGKTAARYAPPTPVTQVIPDAATPAATVAPAEYEEFYVGPMVDPDNSAFAYRPGSLFVRTRPEELQLGAPDDPRWFSPATAARWANDHPEPTETEVAALAFRSERAIQALTEENERLRAERKTPSKSSAASAAKATGPAPVSAGPGAARQTDSVGAPSDDESLNTLAPNADYTIELDPHFLTPPAVTVDNPFIQLYQPPVKLHDIDLIVSATLPGPKPSAVLNDEPYSVGDKFGDLIVYRIEPDKVYLRKDSFLLACPVSAKVLKLRLP